jgi:hypothetical protein
MQSFWQYPSYQMWVSVEIHGYAPGVTVSMRQQLRQMKLKGKVIIVVVKPYNYNRMSITSIYFARWVTWEFSDVFGETWGYG